MNLINTISYHSSCKFVKYAIDSRRAPANPRAQHLAVRALHLRAAALAPAHRAHAAPEPSPATPLRIEGGIKIVVTCTYQSVPAYNYVYAKMYLEHWFCSSA